MASFKINAQVNQGEPVGLIVDGRANENEFGAQEGLPQHIKVHVPEWFLGDLYPEFFEPWMTAPNLTAVQFDQVTATYEVLAANDNARLATSTPSSISNDGLFQFTAADLNGLIDAYKALITGESINGVTFSFMVYDAVVAAFIEQGRGVYTEQMFTETNYNQTTGIHTIDFNYSTTAKSATSIEKDIGRLNGNVTAHNFTTKIVTIEYDNNDIVPFTREVMIARLTNQSLSNVWWIPDVSVANVVDAGGQQTVTPAQFRNAAEDLRTL